MPQLTTEALYLTIAWSSALLILAVVALVAVNRKRK